MNPDQTGRAYEDAVSVAGHIETPPTIPDPMKVFDGSAIPEVVENPPEKPHKIPDECDHKCSVCGRRYSCTETTDVVEEIDLIRIAQTHVRVCDRCRSFVNQHATGVINQDHLDLMKELFLELGDFKAYWSNMWSDSLSSINIMSGELGAMRRELTKVYDVPAMIREAVQESREDMKRDIKTERQAAIQHWKTVGRLAFGGVGGVGILYLAIELLR